MFAALSRKDFLKLSAAAETAMALSPAVAVHGAQAAQAAEDFPDSTIAENEVLLWPGEAPGSEGCLRLAGQCHVNACRTEVAGLSGAWPPSTPRC